MSRAGKRPVVEVKIINRQDVRSADVAGLVLLLREQATWFDDEGVNWLLLTRAADELEKGLKS